MKKYILLLLLMLSSSIIVYSQINKDMSVESNISIDEPRLAYVNITGVDSMPTTKEDNLHAWFEYSDEKGNYFKKRIILNAQGATSLLYDKKNFAVDFCEDEWVGDKETDFKIGNWVKQSGFHFKASWLDSFRSGLAVATSYKFYDDIVADEVPILERAGLEDYSKKALCHPDGFPCIVSLNGQFYGIYAWQLKKNHKNMGMDKDNPKHVWFQTDQYGWDSSTYIDIKNPKNPSDESVGYIKDLVSYCTVLDSLDSILAPNVQIQKVMSRQFDVQSVIDYIIHGLITSNIDGFGKNANFLTYDGVKWFVMPYDLDETFGNSWVKNFQFPADWSFVSDDYRMISSLSYFPFYFFYKFYWNEIKERYAQLRDNKTITTDNIIRHLIDWNSRVGTDNYLSEYTKWNTCPSNGKTIIDNNWQLVEDWSDYSSKQKFDASKEYSSGDTCRYDYRIFIAKNNVCGKTPIIQNGYTDTESRVREWLDRRIALEDKYLHYYPETNIEAVNNNSQNDKTPNPQHSTPAISIDGKIHTNTKGLHGVLFIKDGRKYINGKTTNKWFRSW